jgi:hypothetical protein
MKPAAHPFGYTPDSTRTCAYDFRPVDPALSPSLNSRGPSQTAQRPPHLRNPGTEVHLISNDHKVVGSSDKNSKVKGRQ